LPSKKIKYYCFFVRHSAIVEKTKKLEARIMVYSSSNEYYQDTDGDGKVDYGYGSYDTDGDGYVDTVVEVWDTDGDGYADVSTAYADTDGDGYADVAYGAVDYDGDGYTDYEATASVDDYGNVSTSETYYSA
jgi:hypothetical protein